MTGIDRRTMMGMAAAAAALAPVAAGARTPGWRPRAPMPYVAQEIYAARWGARIVTAGGLLARPGGGLAIVDRTGVYDPAADVWTEGPRLPEARHHPMIVESGGRVYALGGYGRSGDGDWTAMTDVWRLDDEAWTVVGRMPRPQSETVGLGHDGRIHLISGRAPRGAANGQWNDQADITDHQVFIPAEGRWEDARPAPQARNSAAGAVLDGALWVAGGRRVEGGGTGRLDRYDPQEDRWDTLAPIPPSPQARRQVGGGLAMAVSDGRLVAFGGEWFEGRGGGVFVETWIYDPTRDAWSAGPVMTTPRHGLAAAEAEGVIYAIGGGEVVSGGRAGAVVEAFTLQSA